MPRIWQRAAARKAINEPQSPQASRASERSSINAVHFCSAACHERCCNASAINCNKHAARNKHATNTQHRNTAGVRLSNCTACRQLILCKLPASGNGNVAPLPFVALICPQLQLRMQCRSLLPFVVPLNPQLCMHTCAFIRIRSSPLASIASIAAARARRGRRLLRINIHKTMIKTVIPFHRVFTSIMSCHAAAIAIVCGTQKACIELGIVGREKRNATTWRVIVKKFEFEFDRAR